MIKKYFFAALMLFALSAQAQIDGGLLLGLVTGTTAEINTIINPPVGSLVFNTEDEKMYLNTSSGFAKIPSISGGASDFWNIDGNVGSNATINFIGTSDAQDLVFRTNNIEAIRLLQSNQNIGINTPTPSEKLDVNGSLRVRSINTTTSDLDILMTTADGVIEKRAFADVAGADGLSVTGAALNSDKDLIITLSDASTLNAGQVVPPKLNFGGRWTNTDIGTNLNVDDTVVPIFGNENYKDDGTDLYEVTGNMLTVKEAGRYDIRVNLSVIGVEDTVDTTDLRTNTNARIAVNGTPVSALGATAYIRFSGNGNRQSSIHITEILQIAANDVISIISYQEANTGIVNFSAVNESSFIINKLK